MKFLVTFLALMLATVVQAQTSQLRSLDTEYAAARWKAVGRIDFGQGAFCSGTLIAPNLVLTAAHCLYRPGTDELWLTRDILFLAGLRDGDAQAVRKAGGVAAHAQFDPTGPLTAKNVAHDVALIQLTEPISTFDVPPFAVAVVQEPQGSVSIVSYGRGRETAQSRQKECQITHRVGEALIFDCDVTFGSSGAPVFADQNGRGQVISVVSGMIEMEGQMRSVGMVLPQRVAELKSQLNLQVPVATARVRRITVGNGSARSGIGAKFIKP